MKDNSTFIALILTAIIGIAQFKEHPKLTVFGIIALVIIAYVGIIHKTREKPIPHNQVPDNPKAKRKKRNKHIDPAILSYLPYSVNRKQQLDHMEMCFSCKDDLNRLMWLIHGDNNQCHEEFLECVRLFHWEDITSSHHMTQPKLIFFECPDIDNIDNFNQMIQSRLWNKVKTNKDDVIRRIDFYQPFLLASLLSMSIFIWPPSPLDYFDP